MKVAEMREALSRSMLEDDTPVYLSVDAKAGDPYAEAYDVQFTMTKCPQIGCRHEHIINVVIHGTVRSR